MFISGLKEKDIVESFTEGASELVGVSLIIGLARGVNLVLEQGMISDTILDYMSNLVSGMPGSIFILGQLVVFIFLGLIVHHQLCHGQRRRERPARDRRAPHHGGRSLRGRGDHGTLRGAMHQHRHTERAHDSEYAGRRKTRTCAWPSRRARPRRCGREQTAHGDGAADSR